MNRLPRLFVERAPELQDFFILATTDDTQGTISNTDTSPSVRQMFLTTGGMIAVIDGVIAGCLVGLTAGAVLASPSAPALAAGGIVFVVVLVTHQAYQHRMRRRHERSVPVIFPCGGGSDKARL